MLICINKNLPEYQTLKKKSGVQEPILEATCRRFLNDYGRFPNLDEIRGSNSEPHLRKELELSDYNSTKIDSILEKTNTESIEDAVVSLNENYKDLEVDITPIKEDAIVEVEHRPTVNNYSKPHVEIDANVDERQVFNNALYKLANMYGIKFIPITDAELNSESWSGITGVQQANAFIYDGDIYINVDKNSVDAPLHEMMHMLVGSMRFTNPKLYQQIVDSIESIPDFALRVQKYPNRTMNDVKEEIFVTEMAKLLIGDASALSNLDQSILYEVMYNTKRLLDSILMGENSVGTITPGHLFGMSLKELTKAMNSTIMTTNFNGTINVEGAELHRKLNNIKSELMESRNLKEYCE